MHPKNQYDVLKLILAFRDRFTNTKDIWLYTGYTLDELLSMNDSHTAESILSNIDVLVDGRFVLEEKDITLKYRGSRNQRLIDVKATLDYSNPVLLDI